MTDIDNGTGEQRENHQWGRVGSDRAWGRGTGAADQVTRAAGNCDSATDTASRRTQQGVHS